MDNDWGDLSDVWDDGDDVPEPPHDLDALKFIKLENGPPVWMTERHKVCLIFGIVFRLDHTLKRLLQLSALVDGVRLFDVYVRIPDALKIKRLR